MSMNNEMTFEFPTSFQRDRFASTYEDVCEPSDRVIENADGTETLIPSVVFDDVPDALVDDVMLEAQRCEGTRVK